VSRYQPYPEYKDSGVEWLGQVPESWDVRKLKYSARIQGGKDQKDVIDDNGQFPVYGSGGIFGYAKAYLYDGESLLLGRKGTIDKPLYVNGKFWTVDTMYYTIMSSNTVAKWLYYASTTIKFDYFQYGSAVPSMTQEDLHNIPFATPAESIQMQLVEFLDRETTKIDTLIEKQQRLIELLKEKRQAVISHAVTKGLDPNVKMKDSGVKWLGKVPEHWDIVQSRRLFEQRKERARQDDEQLTASQKYGMISQKKFMEIEGRKVTQVLTGSEILKHVEPGDFVISMRSFQGGLEYCGYTGSVSSAYIGLIPIKHIQARFFTYLFKSKPYIQALQSTSNLVRDGQALRFDNFSLVSLIIVPDDEQNAIADYLDNQIKYMDNLEDKANRAIILLKERRTALISAAVTGKIDVRGEV
jgi:type I restriction enzyme, S subunit